MKKNIPTALFLSAFLMAGCNKLCQERELTIKRQDYTGTELRTDGYYYGVDSTDTAAVPTAQLIFLYRNGVYFDQFSVPLADAENGTLGADDFTVSSTQGRTRRAWGSFRVTGKMMEMETWQASYMGCANTYRQKGETLNDTTFSITRLENLRKNGKISGERELTDVYHFHASAVKPDSTNNFVR